MIPSASSSQPSFLTLTWNSIFQPFRLVLLLVWCGVSLFLSAALGYTKLGKETWQARGTLRFDSQPVYAGSRPVYNPPNEYSVTQLLASSTLLAGAAEDAGVAASGEQIAAQIETDVPINTRSIVISLEWPEREEAARLVHAAMLRVISERHENRDRQLDAAAGQLRSRIRSERQEYQEKSARLDEMLTGQNLEGKPPREAFENSKENLRELERDLKFARREENQLLGELALLDQMEQQRKENNPEGLAPEEQDRQKEIAIVEGRLKRDRQLLAIYTDKARRLLPQLRDRVITPEDYDEVRLKVLELRAEVEVHEEVLKRLQSSENAPEQLTLMGQLRLQASTKLNSTRTQLESLQLEMKNEQARADRLQKILNDFEPRIKELDRLKQAIDQSELALAELATFRDSSVPELSIATPAYVSDFPIARSHMKWTLGLFGLSVMGLLMSMLGWDVWRMSGSFRFMAWRLGLPVLADYTGSRHPGRSTRPGREENLAQTRGLALRLCQRVPEPGGLVLFCPLTGVVRLDRLTAELGSYLARHEEKVLIIDVALTEQSGWQGIVGAPAEDGHVTLFETPTLNGHEQPKSLKSVMRPLPEPDPEEASIFDELQSGRPAPPTVGGLSNLETSTHSGTRLNGPPSLAEISRTGHSGCLDPHQSASDYLFTTQIPNVDYLPVGNMAVMGSVITLTRLRTVINEMRQRYTLLLMTGPVIATPADYEVLAGFAQALVVVGEDRPESFSKVSSIVESMRAAVLPLVGAVVGEPEDVNAPSTPETAPMPRAPAWASRVR